MALFLWNTFLKAKSFCYFAFHLIRYKKSLDALESILDTTKI